MHPITEVGTNVSAFLAKLWRMVEDPETNDLICWNSDGTSFMIKNQSQFAKELLPMYYKHNNMASFIRQLNMYGFHKVVSAESNGLRMTDNDEISFSHHCFIRGHPYLLEHIKRKMTVTKESNEIRAAPDLMNKMLNDVKSMKGRQESLDSKLSTMKQENEALWRELSILRQKHAKQQTIVNKLIQFLVTLVHPTRNLSVKRRSNFPLMLKEKAHNPHNSHKYSYISDSKKRYYNNSGPDSTSPSPTGPTIHELDPSDFLESVQILENNKHPTSMLRSDSPLSPTITDCDSNDEDISVESPTITSKIRNNLDDGTLLDLVTEVVSPEEELITVPPEDVNPAICALNKNVTSSANSVRAVNKQATSGGVTKALEEKKCKPLTFKGTVAMDEKLVKRSGRGGRGRKATSVPVVDSTLKTILTKTKPKTMVTQPTQRAGLKVKMPVRSGTEINKVPAQNLKRPQMIASEVPSPKSKKMDDVSVSKPQEIFVPGSPQIQQDAMIAPNVSMPGSLQVDINATSPVGIVTMPSPVNGELQQIFEPSPLNDSILGMPDTFFSIPENSGTSERDSVENTNINSDAITISADEMLNQVSSTSPVESNMNDMALALSSPAQVTLSGSGNNCNPLNRFGFPTDFNSHVETVQNDLDCLKELLQKEGLSLDTNMLMGLFNNEDSINFNPPAYQNPINQTDPTDMSQNYNQVAAYNPTNMDLTDVFHNSDWNVPMTEQTNDDDDELFKDLNTPIISIPNSPTTSPSPLTNSSVKKRKK